MRKPKQKKPLAVLIAAALVIIALTLHYYFTPWGFYWKVPAQEASHRIKIVETAQKYLGLCETDGSHQKIIDAYNTHEPLAIGYKVTYSDSWCAAFVSAIAIECGYTDIIPTECGCERQIALFQSLECWEEYDGAVPLPGDIIYYDWDENGLQDCMGWSDHVGIVVGTKWPFIKVIEGNRDDSVRYRTIFINDIHIRGYGKPNYSQLTQKLPAE